MSKTSDTHGADGDHNCIDCELWQAFADDTFPSCMNLITWRNGTPPNPPCFQAKAEFLTALKRHLRLVDTLGMDHPDTMRAMMLSMHLAPKALQDEFLDMTRKMGLLPETCGYLEDGSPMVRLEDVAERLGISLAQAEEAMRKILAEREALGLSNAGLVTDAAWIHRKQ